MRAVSQGCFLLSEVTKENASVRNRKLCDGFILAGCFDVAGDVFTTTIEAGHFQGASQPTTSWVLTHCTSWDTESQRHYNFCIISITVHNNVTYITHLLHYMFPSNAINTGRFFYRCPKHRGCHGISRRIQAFYAIKLP
jgi:hypothetical protein